MQVTDKIFSIAYGAYSDQIGREPNEEALRAALTAALSAMPKGITLNANQLAQALEFAAPDYAKDVDQRETEIHIERLEAGKYNDDTERDAGLYCWLIEYPEEGSIPLTKGEAVSFAPPAPAIPDSWTNCHISFEGGAPEDVAFGPKLLMERLAKWLQRYHNILAASKSPLPNVPKPSKFRRQQQSNGSYAMVPAYTASEMLEYGDACRAAMLKGEGS